MNRLKVLHCTTGSKNKGGIPAVVNGFTKGFAFYNDEIIVKRITYTRYKPDINKMHRLLSDIFLFFRFILSIIVENPKIIHFQSSFGKSAILRDNIYIFSSRIFHKKIIIHAHGGQWHEYKAWPTHMQKKADYWATNVNRIIVTSTEEYKLADSIWGNKINISKLNNPIILNENINISKNKVKQIIFASRLIKEKGVLDVLESIKHIKSDGYIINIFGDGELKNTITDVINNSKEISNKVVYKNFVSFEKLIEKYNKSDIFLFPSYHLEGFPMSFFYALSCGLAMITTRVRPIPEYLIENKNCLFIDSKNPIDLANKIDILLSNTILTEKMQLDNIKLSRQFDYKLVTKQLVDIYKQC